jgi:ubiquinone/menaquinone biosynthesis C-methylase UbiE
MKDRTRVSDIEVKRANIIHHDVEAKIFERAHPEGSSIYERANVSKNIAFIAENSNRKNLCIDVGCGTGFVTSFELSLYKTVVATDISRCMLEVARKRLCHFGSLNLLVCDAEYLPLKGEIADLVSVSSVLHHLPNPLDSIMGISGILREGGFLYITREPNFQRQRRFFDFLDECMHAILRKLTKFLKRLTDFESELSEPNITVEGLDYDKVDIHSVLGFDVVQLTEFFRSKYFEIVFAYSYHWIYPDSDRGLLQQLLTKSNFVIEKIPISKKFGRYVNVLARKLERK